MTNTESARLLFESRDQAREDLTSAISNASWNMAIRRAQEVVELSLKGLFRLACVEYPKIHDAGKLLREVIERKGIEVPAEEVGEVTDASRWLAEKRAPAFYGDEVYSEEDANRARDHANRVVSFVVRVTHMLSQQ